MAVENVQNDNVPVSNGNVPTAAQQTTAQKAATATENIITTIVLTIYDVIVFLGISIGYIFQVSSNPSKQIHVHVHVHVHIVGMFSQQNCYK